MQLSACNPQSPGRSGLVSAVDVPCSLGNLSASNLLLSRYGEYKPVSIHSYSSACVFRLIQYVS